MTFDHSQLAAENAAKFLEDGPMLRLDWNVWVEARCTHPTDPNRTGLLLGGVGAMGMGRMWIEEPRNDPTYYCSHPGYAEATTEMMRDDFGDTAPFWLDNTDIPTPTPEDP